MKQALKPSARLKAPWRGRPRAEDPKTSFIAVRCTAEERARIAEAAALAGLSIGAYLRTLALGKAGPRARRRPPIEREELARLLGHLGKIGSNLNQIAHAFNSRQRVPAAEDLRIAREEITRTREALMKALGRDH